MNKVFEKLAFRDEDITIRSLDNGYVIEVSGRNAENDWETVKYVVLEKDEMVSVLYAILERIPLKR